jgi:hypothetical protein
MITNKTGCIHLAISAGENRRHGYHFVGAFKPLAAFLIGL